MDRSLLLTRADRPQVYPLDGFVLRRTGGNSSAGDDQLNRLWQMLRDVSRYTAAEQLHHRWTLRGANDEKIDAHRRGKIHDRCGGVLTNGVKWDDVNVALAAELAHRAHDSICLGVILPVGTAK